MKFSILMTVFEPWETLSRALSGVGQQTYADWELCLLLDGPAPPGRQHPQQVLRSFRRYHPRQRIELCELPRAPGCWGNVGRHVGLTWCAGDYVCWVNHDNLIFPNYLALHHQNIIQCPGCVSVVGIEYWRASVCHGPFPRALARSRLDLLNYCVPLKLARETAAFGPEQQHVYAADWLTFAACQARAPVMQTPEIAGVHF